MASLEPDDDPLPAPTTTRTLTPTAARSRSRRSNASTSSSRLSSRAVSLVRTAEQALPQIGEPGPSGSSAVLSPSLPSEVLATTDPGPSSVGGVGWSSGPLTEEIQTREEVAPADQEDDISDGKGKKRKAAEAAIEDAIYGEGAARRRRVLNGKGKAVASDPADDSAEEDISSPAPDAEVAIASDGELLQSALPATTSLPVVAPPEARVPASEPQYLHTYNCSVCLAPPKNATLIPCGHIFCGECLFTSVRIAMRNITPYGTTMARCPLCRTHIPGWDGHGGGVIGLKPKTMTTISDLDL